MEKRHWPTSKPRFWPQLVPKVILQTLDPDSLEALAGLRVLDLSDNGLEALPDEITLLQMLQRLDLTNNYLSK